MGLCKCPKKKVTNLFCFEHRVNVCEHCVVANHDRCVVKSYIQWLQDSDYDPSCPLCQSDLSHDTQNECVRLMCYDVFHWECLNRYAQQLPTNTAPAGYVCPKCRESLFPASNIQSPVADALRATLSRVNWARAGLGLPLIQESHEPTQRSTDQTSSHSVFLPESSNTGYTRPSAQVLPYTSTPVTYHQEHSVVNMDVAVAQSRGSDKSHMHSEPRRLFEDNPATFHKSDHDVDKYKRRSAFTWLARWFKSHDANSRHKAPMSSSSKYMIIGLIVVIFLLTFIVILSRLGSYVTDDDPAFDPRANPNIRVHEEMIQPPAIV